MSPSRIRTFMTVPILNRRTIARQERPHILPMANNLVSAKFSPTARLLGVLDDRAPDITTRSCDSCLFYCHRSILSARSSNNFNGLINPGAQRTLPPQHYLALLVTENSAVLNIILYVIFAIPFRKYQPSVDLITLVFGALPKYGLRTPVKAKSNIWTVLKHHAMVEPLQVYALGAHVQAHPICEWTS